jgi:hypothetical protein
MSCTQFFVEELHVRLPHIQCVRCCNDGVMAWQSCSGAKTHPHTAATSKVSRNVAVRIAWPTVSDPFPEGLLVFTVQSDVKSCAKCVVCLFITVQRECACLLLQDLVQNCLHGGRGFRETVNVFVFITAGPSTKLFGDAGIELVRLGDEPRFLFV